MTKKITTKNIQMEGELFEAVQMAQVFDDGKSFVDHRIVGDPETILMQFQAERDLPDFDLPTFVSQHFTLHATSMRNHIRRMWQQLYRAADKPDSNSNLLPLPHPYIVPGGRFREIYYWDSYFSALGLLTDDHPDWVESLVANFAHLINIYGHIPNGNRLYYLSRSQPPFFCCLLQLLQKHKGIKSVYPYLLHLKAEYEYWMAGTQGPAALTTEATQHLVQLPNGMLLNRYWDEQDTPRNESYREDIEAIDLQVKQNEAYRHLRAGAESGWDFSSRWLTKDNWDLATIKTTNIIPIDLNCLIFNMENQLGLWLADFQGADFEKYRLAAEKRRTAIQTYCWNDNAGWFFDYNWVEQKQTEIWSLAGVYPLFFEIATQEQADQVAANISNRFLRDGGVVTTLYSTGQQWDAPNGWAPLQWMTVQGLIRYGHDSLARTIAKRFVTLANKTYQATGKMMEKYDVCDLSKSAGGGEYPNQDGFGWTNGVVAAFCEQFNFET